MTSDADLLRELARLDSVEAAAVGAEDHSYGHTAQWCEILLKLEGPWIREPLQLTRHDAELIIEVLHNVLHPNTHRTSPVERLWALLDDQMDFLLADEEPEPEDKARARALAEAIVLVRNPFVDPEHIDVTEVREEAVRRWENRP